MFEDRQDAALQLAKALEKYKGKKVVVVGIPRGGVETAYYVARELDAELSVLICRKLGFPGNPEYAFGALAEDGTIHFNTAASGMLSQEHIDEIVEQQKKEIGRRIQTLRKGKPLPDIKGKTVIIADDGIATGSTIFAAIKMCKNQGAGKIVVAAPVSSTSTAVALGKIADEVVILEKPDFYHAVSQAYYSFGNLTDREALGFLERWEKEKTTAKSEET